VDLTFVARNTTLTDAMKEYAVKRLAKLDRRFREPAPVQLEVRKESTRNEDQRYVAEVTIRLKGSMVRCEERGPTPYAAIDAVEQTLDSRIRRWKAQFDRRRREGSRLKESVMSQLAEVPAPEAETGEEASELTNGKVVKVKHHAVTPMSVEDAAAQMELLGHSFYVFLNDKSKAINVVYRRMDQDYGLIVPQPGLKP